MLLFVKATLYKSAEKIQLEEVCEYCPECGNKSLRTVVQHGMRYEECELCGYVTGDEDSIQVMLDEQEAYEFDIDVAVFPLVKELNEIKGVRTLNSNSGSSEARILPVIDFSISGHLQKMLTNLVTSLKLSNRETDGYWYIEPFLNGELSFSLKPRMLQDYRDIKPEQIVELHNDLRILARNLQMHRNLSWWRI